MFEGDTVERDDAKFFNDRANTIKTTFPKTAKVLRQLATGYEKDAKVMDEIAVQRPKWHFYILPT